MLLTQMSHAMPVLRSASLATGTRAWVRACVSVCPCSSARAARRSTTSRFVSTASAPSTCRQRSTSDPRTPNPFAHEPYTCSCDSGHSRSAMSRTVCTARTRRSSSSCSGRRCAISLSSSAERLTTLARSGAFLLPLRPRLELPRAPPPIASGGGGRFCPTRTLRSRFSFPPVSSSPPESPREFARSRGGYCVVVGGGGGGCGTSAALSASRRSGKASHGSGAGACGGGGGLAEDGGRGGG
mmetsp:Transcript_11408/g.37460  ORF Transcript_11408/g.37460 Transcript_11408/m.37460 type:complete len:241 (-) Transcript_11408:787-1509(-)